jgi:hypothetical protein
MIILIYFNEENIILKLIETEGTICFLIIDQIKFILIKSNYIL